MKVICIDGKRSNSETYYDLPEGVILEAFDAPDPNYNFVVGMERDPVTGILTDWHKRRFIPLSTIDETEFERNYQKEPAWIEAFNKL